KAVEGLRESAHIKDCYTLAKLIGSEELGFRGDFDKGLSDTLLHHARQLGRAALHKPTWKMDNVTLDRNTVVVLDEAGQLPTWALEKLTREVQRKGATLILCGDPKQLQPIGPGGPMASLVERFP